MRGKKLVLIRGNSQAGAREKSTDRREQQCYAQYRARVPGEPQRVLQNSSMYWTHK